MPEEACVAPLEGGIGRRERRLSKEKWAEQESRGVTQRRPGPCYRDVWGGRIPPMKKELSQKDDEEERVA